MDGILFGVNKRYYKFIKDYELKLKSAGIPEWFWPVLHKKLHENSFEPGSSFRIVQIDKNSETKPYDVLLFATAAEDIDKNDPNHIYLLRTRWCFRHNSFQKGLRRQEQLLDELCNLLQVSAITIEERIEEVYKNIWKYAHTDLGNKRDPIWHVFEKFGSSITHSETPNFKLVPFLYSPEGKLYSIMYYVLFPIENVKEGDTITRNFLEEHYADPLHREALLIPWKEYRNFHEDFTCQEPNSIYFAEDHDRETLPDLSSLKAVQKAECKLKVFSNYINFAQFLTCPDFEIVDNEYDADILWYINDFKTYEDLSIHCPGKFVNQFPFEKVITNKKLLSVVAQYSDNTQSTFSNKLETSPPWYPTTFNMNTELTKLVAYYMQRNKAGLDNHWICEHYVLDKTFYSNKKPKKFISNCLGFLCRLPTSGSYIAQKFTENPVLFDIPDEGSLKFHIRFFVLLKSVKPTEVYVYQKFFIRTSNINLDKFKDYGKHYWETESLLSPQFKDAWSKQYPDHDWADIEKSIHEMFSEVFKAATSREPPCGIAKSPQSRALFAADIILSWQTKEKEAIQPKLLDITRMPDSWCAGTYYPDLYNDIFSVLFLDKQIDACIKLL